MNWSQIQGKWDQVKGKARAEWGRLTDDDLDVIRGNKERLIGRLEEAYGIAREEIEKQVNDWMVKLRD